MWQFCDKIIADIWRGFLFKAFVLSSFIIGVSAWVNYGYETLLKQIDGLVPASYGNLSELDSPELGQTGQEIINSYYSYRTSH